MEKRKPRTALSISSEGKANLSMYPIGVALTAWLVFYMISILPAPAVNAKESRASVASHVKIIVLNSPQVPEEVGCLSIANCGLSAMAEAQTDITAVAPPMTLRAGDGNRQDNRDRLDMGGPVNAVASVEGGRFTASGRSVGDRITGVPGIRSGSLGIGPFQYDALSHVREYLQTKK